MSSHGDGDVRAEDGVGDVRAEDGVGDGESTRFNLLGMTRQVYDFLKNSAKSEPDGDVDGDGDGDGWGQDDGGGDAHRMDVWAKAKGIVQHQYALTPLSWACVLHEYSIEGRAISVDDFAWLWHFPDVEHAPLSRLVGYGWFCGRRYDLNAATLDPRWESEGLMDIVCAHWGTQGTEKQGAEKQGAEKQGAEKALSRQAGTTQQVGPRILDVGTGSGCLLIQLLLHYPSAWGVGVDISADALLMAGKNAHRHGVAERVSWLVGDCTEVLMGSGSSRACADAGDRSKSGADAGDRSKSGADAGGAENRQAQNRGLFKNDMKKFGSDGQFSGDSDPLGSGTFDIIVSNPPYVPTGYVAPKNVALWDPDAALYAGIDGLDCYRSWIGPMVRCLAPCGILVLEIGFDQGPAVQSLCQQAGLSQIHILPDDDGKNRYVWGRL